MSRHTAQLASLLGAALLLASGCAPGGEVADELAQAEAVPAEPETQQKQQESPEPIVSDEPVTVDDPPRFEPLDVTLDRQQLAERIDEAPDSELANIAGALAITPDATECDGEPCEICEIGWSATHRPAETSMTVHSCCAQQGCFNEIRFSDDELALGLFGESFTNTAVSPDGERVAVFSSADTEGDEPVAVVDTDVLRQLAAPADEPLALVDRRELLDEASWALQPADLHRLEALSARAVEEAQQECDEGSHLPTLIELAEDAEPLSDRLQIEFERWLDSDRVLVATRSGDDESLTALVLDLETECMVRTSRPDRWAPLRTHLIAPENRRWEPADAFRIDGEEVSTGVVRGVLFSQTAPETATTQAEHLAAAIRIGDERFDVDSGDIALRMIGDAEWLLWVSDELDTDELLDSDLEAAPRLQKDGWRIPATLMFEAPEEDEVILEFFIEGE